MVVCCSKWVFSVLAYFYFHMSTLYFSTAEAVLQKMDDMEKMRRRRRMGDLEEFHDTEEVDTDLFCWFCISRVIHREIIFLPQEELTLKMIDISLNISSVLVLLY